MDQEHHPVFKLRIFNLINPNAESQEQGASIRSTITYGKADTLLRERMENEFQIPSM